MALKSQDGMILLPNQGPWGNRPGNDQPPSGGNGNGGGGNDGGHNFVQLLRIAEELGDGQIYAGRAPFTRAR